MRSGVNGRPALAVEKHGASSHRTKVDTVPVEPPAPTLFGVVCFTCGWESEHLWSDPEAAETEAVAHEQEASRTTGHIHEFGDGMALGQQQARAAASRIELLPSEFAEVVERGKAWLAVYEPCGTEGCDSPTCQLAYAMRRAIAAEEAIPGVE